MTRRACGTAAGAALALLLVLAPGVRAQQVEARLDRESAIAGESVSLIVTVREGKPAGDPQFDLPDGLSVLSSGRNESFSWINGKATSETQFRYEIGVDRAGHYAIGPIQVRVGDRAFRSGTMVLEATAAQRQVGGRAGSGAASLIVNVEPREPYVGEPVTLRVRLVQRAVFAAQQYTPPTTTGFWSGASTQPSSYYADENGRRVLVTETRTRLYPLASGEAVIGEATMAVELAGADASDPFAWLNGGGSGRTLTITSPAIRVQIRPLPGNPPDGFGGAVGRYTVAWHADRERTGRDVPFTLRLDVRGRGNLPLVRPPDFQRSDLEVLASSVDDSLGDPAADVGRKRFQWTVLARHEGTLSISAPGFVSFDPEARQWMRQQAVPVTMDVGPPVYAGTGVSAGFPVELATEPVPDAPRAVRSWVFALAGLLLGLAVVMVRRSGAADPGAAERARALEWLRAVGRTSGPDFWRSAEQALDWLAERGQAVDALRSQVASARYGGAGADPENVRRGLVERISRALPASPPRGTLRAVAALAFAVAVAAVAFLGWTPPPTRIVSGLAAADAAARRGDVAGAETVWNAAWNGGVRHPALAARLGWARLDDGAMGEAAVWVLRGRRLEARDEALAWTAGRVREGGGLIGSGGPLLPLRRLEWGVLGLVLGALAGFAWSRRPLGVALLVLAVLAGLAPTLEEARDVARRPAVVVRTVHVGSEGIELLPGQVVRVLAGRAREFQVAAGRAATGWVPADAVLPVDRGGGSGS